MHYPVDLPHYPPFGTRIAKLKDESIIKHNNQQNSKHCLAIYSDSSGLNSHIGAAVVIPSTWNHITLHYQLEEISKHIIFEGELVGIILALDLAT